MLLVFYIWVMRCDVYFQDSKMVDALKSNFFAILAIAIVVVSIYLTYGLKVNGTVEEYNYLSLPILDNAIDLNESSRPLLQVFFFLGAKLTPYSFVGFNTLNILLIWLRGVIFYFILRRINLPFALALVSSLLFTISPVHGNILRYVGIQWVVVTYLLALYCALILQKKFNLFVLIIMWIALAITSLSYEAVFPILIVSPVLFLWQAKRFDSSLLSITFLWCIVPLVTGIRFVYYLNSSPVGYHQRLLDTTITFDVFYYINSIGKSYLYNFYDSWIKMPPRVYNSTLFNFSSALLITVVVGLILYYFPKRYLKDEEDSLSAKSLIGLLFWGLIAVGAGFLLYIPVGIEGYISRAFFLSSVGTILVVLLVLFLAIQKLLSPKYQHVVFVLMTSFLFFLTLINASFEREIEVNHAYRQQRFLSSIVENIPNFEQDTAPKLIIFDPDLEILSMNFPNFRLEATFQVIYDNQEIELFVCYPNEAIQSVPERCSLHDDHILIAIADEETEYLYTDLILLSYSGDEELTILNNIPEAYQTETMNDEIDSYTYICEDCPYPETTNAFFVTFPFNGYVHESPIVKSLFGF